MKLSDQIALLRETLEEFGYAAEAGESTGEVADAVIRQAESNKQVYLEAAFQESTQSDKDRIAQLVEENEVLREELMRACQNEVIAIPSADGLCDSCRSLDNSKHVPRLCMDAEAWRQGFSRRGYSVKAGHGCEEWSG
jgi:hypothetical protein